MKIDFIQLRQSDIAIRILPSIYQAPQYLIESGIEVLNKMPASRRMHYLESHPPKFRKGGPYHWLVGNHFTYCMILLSPKKPFWALIYEAKDYPDDSIADCSAMDQWDLEGLVKNNKGLSKPTEIKKRRIDSGQYCVFCDSDLNMKIALVGPNNAVHIAKVMKEGKEGKEEEAKLKCPNCGRQFPVTWQQLVAFSNYTLKAEDLIQSESTRMTNPHLVLVDKSEGEKATL